MFGLIGRGDVYAMYISHWTRAAQRRLPNVKDAKNKEILA
jgi:hypothetical protein